MLSRISRGVYTARRPHLNIGIRKISYIAKHSALTDSVRAAIFTRNYDEYNKLLKKDWSKDDIINIITYLSYREKEPCPDTNNKLVCMAEQLRKEKRISIELTERKTIIFFDDLTYKQID